MQHHVRKFWSLVWLVTAVWLPISALQADEPESLPALTEIHVVSSLDQTEQPALLWAPKTAQTTETPILIFLHSWSGGYLQNNAKWQKEACQRGWIYLHPDFRGRNDHPEACGSALARQDILDCLDYVQQNYRVDSRRIYLAGASGGGHMSMLMAGHHPERFSAVSAWVGISDLAAWYRFHTKQGVPQNYAQMVLKSVGGAPGSGPEVDAQYRDRSPVYHLKNVGDLPIHLHAGIYDGHRGSVPIRHSLLAFNEIARANGYPVISEEVMQSLSAQGQSTATQEIRIENVAASAEREICFQQEAGAAVVTIFEGGHEGLPETACRWLAEQVRETSPEQTTKIVSP